jgi:hypothetical protein
MPDAFPKTQHPAFGARCWRDPIAFLASGSSRPIQAPTSIPLKRPEHSCLESLSATTAGAIYPSLLPGCGPRPRGGSNLTFRVLGSRASQSSRRTPEPTTTFLQNEAWHTLSERGPKGPSSHPVGPEQKGRPTPAERKPPEQPPARRSKCATAFRRCHPFTRFFRRRPQIQYRQTLAAFPHRPSGRPIASWTGSAR